jgi:hypothetical protein
LGLTRRREAESNLYFSWYENKNIITSNSIKLVYSIVQAH